MMQKDGNDVFAGELRHLKLQEAEGYGSLFQEALDAKIEEAKAKGFEIVRGNDYLLLLDLDSPEAEAQFDRVYPVIEEHFGAFEVLRWKSKSGHAHAMVALLRPQAATVRYALQAALGSDGKREALSLVQLANGCTEPSVLFKPCPSLSS